MATDESRESLEQTVGEYQRNFLKQLQEIDNLKALLRELEYCNRPPKGEQQCYFCGAFVNEPHESDCRWRAAQLDGKGVVDNMDSQELSDRAEADRRATKPREPGLRLKGEDN